MSFFAMLLDHDYELVRSPAGAKQWQPVGNPAETLAPGAHSPERRVPTMMTTADMAMKMDPEYRKISERFRNDPAYFADTFARAWFKLTHRDMGPKVRYLGPDVPAEDLIWQDPIPAGTPLSDADVTALKGRIAESGLTVGQLVKTAWASAGTYRGSDHRGGANGGRLRLSPQRDWEVNEPAELAKVLGIYEGIKQSSGIAVSIADLIVLGGNVGIEQAARAAGHDVTVPFTSGRGDASQEQTDIEGFAVLEPRADGFRNYLQVRFSVPTEELLIDRAQLLGLSAPEMTVLVGGCGCWARTTETRRTACSPRGRGSSPTTSSSTCSTWARRGRKWMPRATRPSSGTDRASNQPKWTATRTDLVFGSNSQLRALSEVYAARRRRWQVRQGLRRGLGQGDGRGSLRPRLTADAK